MYFDLIKLSRYTSFRENVDLTYHEQLIPLSTDLLSNNLDSSF